MIKDELQHWIEKSLNDIATEEELRALEDSLLGDAQALEVGAAEAKFDRRPEAAKYAIGGDRRRIAAAALACREAHDVAGLASDLVHVGNRRADILGDDIAAAEIFHEAPESVKQGFAFVAFRIADDHALSAARRQLRQRVLVAHRARQAEHVGDGLGFTVVGPHAAAAKGRAERGIVNGDDCAKPAFGVGAKDDFFVPVKRG